MADWKQIQARIRRARTGADPAGQLEKLFEKTRDAMAAYELAVHHEAAGHISDAVRWFGTAAERFRRADWKKKSEEAIARLSGSAPAKAAVAAEPEVALTTDDAQVNFAEPTLFSDRTETASGETPPNEMPEAAHPAEEATAPGALPERKRRRRGRRGGRKHRHGKGGALPAPAEPAAGPRAVETRAVETRAAETPAAFTRAVSAPPDPASAENFHQEVAEPSGPALRGRSGDPGMASRLALLEMQLRRLLACAPIKLEDADRAPAGPGVFVVADSDLVTYYYAESCKTLRIAIGSLLRSGGPGRRDTGESLKARFADHLGIPEARVAKYVGEHCLIRWLQLDDGAAAFAHFTVSVLRPLLNDWE